MIGRGPNKAKALAASFELDPKHQLVWYKILEKCQCPGRFRTKNLHGDWVDLDDPSVSEFTPAAD